jgi:hypothetical protein
MSRATGVLLVAMLTAVPAATVVAQRGTPGPTADLPPLLVRAAGETPVPGKCLFKEDLDLIAARRALTRTTLNNDAEAPFDPDYLVGRWAFEDDVPESAFGPAGPIAGTETIQHVDGCRYEGTTQAKGPAGAFTIKSTLVYDPSAHYLIVLERDSRGFEVLKSGRVGGDSGGYYTHHWQAAPFTVKKAKVKLKGTTFMASPVHFRVRTEMAEGDGPFVNFGTVWMERQGAAGGK